MDEYDAIVQGLFGRQRLLSESGREAKDQLASVELLQVEASYGERVRDQLARFAELKQRLNAVKSQLSAKDISAWHDHTTRTNPSGGVIRELKRRVAPELCTQAWCKFFEVVVAFPAIVPCRGRFRSLHLCEAPGAFVAALNHFVASRELWLQWDWLANTLNPYFEGNSAAQMISDDRLVYETLDRWRFGRDNSGDLMQPANLDELLSVRGDGFDLVTADGSVDCQSDPAEQEMHTYPLHLCESVAALLLLKLGGCLVVKKFTSFEACTISLLYLLSAAFETVHLFKPATSKTGNSEVYVICQRFTGLPDCHLSRLRSEYGSDVSRRTPVVPLDLIPDDFYSIVFGTAQFLADRQLAMMHFNLHSFDSDLQSEIERVQRNVAQRYVDEYGAVAIAKSDMLVTRRQRPPWLRCLARLRHAGTFEQRTAAQPEHQRAMLMAQLDELGRLAKTDWPTEISTRRTGENNWFELGRDSGGVVYGAPIDALLCSKFASADLLAVYLRASSLASPPTRPLLEFELCGATGIRPRERRRRAGSDSAELSSMMIGGESVLRLDDARLDAMDKICWLNLLIRLLKAEMRPDRLVLRRQARLLLLTRFSVCCLTLVAGCFERLRFDRADGASEIVAEGWRGVARPQWSAFLHLLRFSYLRELDDGRDLLQFLPMSTFADGQFFDALSRFNESQLYEAARLMLTRD